MIGDISSFHDRTPPSEERRGRATPPPPGCSSAIRRGHSASLVFARLVADRGVLRLGGDPSQFKKEVKFPTEEASGPEKKNVVEPCPTSTTSTRGDRPSSS